MKKLLLFCLLCASCYGVQAQPGRTVTREVSALEFEVGAGILVGADKLNFDNSRTGASFFVEGRYNLPRIPVDIGVQVNGSIFHRESEQAGELKFKAWNILAVSDYNFFRTSRVSLFAGVGFGYAYLEETAPISFDDTQRNRLGFFSAGERHGGCFVPRVGVEFFHRLRITFDYRLQEKANRHCNLSLGFVFGGGKKQHPYIL